MTRQKAMNASEEWSHFNGNAISQVCLDNARTVKSEQGSTLQNESPPLLLPHIGRAKLRRWPLPQRIEHFAKELSFSQRVATKWSNLINCFANYSWIHVRFSSLHFLWTKFSLTLTIPTFANLFSNALQRVWKGQLCKNSEASAWCVLGCGLAWDYFPSRFSFLRHWA